jgi:hypothetical protein
MQYVMAVTQHDELINQTVFWYITFSENIVQPSYIIML